MINVDAIKELIDQAPEIKTLFTIELPSGFNV